MKRIQPNFWKYLPSILLLIAATMLGLLFSVMARNSLKESGITFIFPEQNKFTIHEAGRYDIYYERSFVQPAPTEVMNFSFVNTSTKEETASYGTATKETYRIIDIKGSMIGRANFMQTGSFEVRMDGNPSEHPVHVRLNRGNLWKPRLFSYLGTMIQIIILVVVAALIIKANKEAVSGYIRKIFNRVRYGRDYQEEEQDTKIISLVATGGIPFVKPTFGPTSFDLIEDDTATTNIAEAPQIVTVKPKTGKVLTNIPKSAQKRYKKQGKTLEDIGSYAKTIEDISKSMNAITEEDLAILRKQEIAEQEALKETATELPNKGSDATTPVKKKISRKEKKKNLTALQSTGNKG